MKYISILLISLLLGCIAPNIPKEKLSQYIFEPDYKFAEGKLQVNMTNTLMCPMRIWVQSEDPTIASYFKDINPVLLRPQTDTIIVADIDSVKTKELVFAFRLGDDKKTVTVGKIGLPFQKGQEYRLIQGYNSTPTHNTDWSRYAMDFDLATGDTICAATSGFVVGVVDGYKHGGKDRRWKDYANFITLYDPTTGLFTQYVHLKFEGSLVRSGDKVSQGQPIGISGMTGWTTIEHVHFNCLQPVHSSDGLQSIRMDSIGNYKISEINRYDVISNSSPD